MTEEHLNAPETTESTPTTQLPEHEPEPKVEATVEADSVAETETEAEAEPKDELADAEPTEQDAAEQGALADESRFEREHRQEQDAAVASLDETVLRPFVTPIDLGPAEEQGYGRPPVPWQSATQTPLALPRFSWRRLGVAAVLAAIALAVGVRSAGSRQTHVGLFGVTTPTEQATPKFATPIQVAPVETAEPEEESYADEEEYVDEEEPVDEDEPSEEWTSEETDEEERSYEDSSERGPHTFIWDFGGPTQYDRDNEGEGKDTSDDSSDETDDYYSYTDRYDSWDDTDDSGDRGSVSWDFDGGNVTYYYDDRTVTVDWDVVDEIERYLDTYDSWGYGVPGGEQGYGDGYGGRNHNRDHGPDYYNFGW